MGMIGWLNVLLVAVVLASALFLLKTKMIPAREDGPWPFYAKRPLSKPEQILYFRLLKALPDHIVLAQVPLSRLLGVESGRDSWAWRNRISRKSADFVVCRGDASVLAVIELDDASHEHTERRAADATKDKALAAAGVRVIRWPAKALPGELAIQAAVSADERVLKGRSQLHSGGSDERLPTAEE
jgi:hypothetical protein